MEPIRYHEDFKEADKNVKNQPQTAQNSPKSPKQGFSKETAVLTHFFFKVKGETQVVMVFSHVRVPYKTDERQRRLQRSRQECQKWLKRL